MRRSFTACAPAKLNLALSVGPAQTPGGLHPICSWMVTLDLCDELLVTRLEPGRLSRYAILWHEQAKRRSDINWSITKDLAVRAHLALERHTGRTLPVQLKLQKRIPVGGGLGGGSSDAAAMLRAVNELFELGLSLDELEGIASSLGSDVPFLTVGGSAIVEGLGERITRHERFPELHVVLAFPQASCPTAQVYGRFDQLALREGASPLQLQPQRVRRLAEAARLAPDAPFNDLAAAAMSVAPRLGDDLERVGRLAQRPAHLSGSGSSLFVVCDDALHAQALARSIEQQLQLPAVSATAALPECGEAHDRQW